MGEFAPYAQLGAVGVLGWVAIVLIGELRAARTDGAAQRAEHTAALEVMMNRWDGWEKTRHEDASAAQETMLTVVRTCAESRQAMANHKAKL